MGLTEEEKIAERIRKKAELDEWFRLVKDTEDYRAERGAKLATNKERLKNQRVNDQTVRQEEGRGSVLRQPQQRNDQRGTPKKAFLKTPQSIEDKYYAWLESPIPRRPPTKLEFAAANGFSSSVIKRLDREYEDWKAERKAKEIAMVDKKLLEKILEGRANAPDFTNYYRRHGLLVDKEEKDIRVYDGTEIARLFHEAKRRGNQSASGVGQMPAELPLLLNPPRDDSEQRDGKEGEMGSLASSA